MLSNWDSVLLFDDWYKIENFTQLKTRDFELDTTKITRNKHYFNKKTRLNDEHSWG